MAAAPQTTIAPILTANLARIDSNAGVSLSRLDPGAEAVILAVEAKGPEGLRLRDLGFVRGTRIRTIRRAPLGDPVEYDLRGYRLCLRRSETDRVRVKPV
jgi:Fe2+ transport system protein FeoA